MAIRSKLRTKEIDRGFNRIVKELKKLQKKPYVKVGYPADASTTKDAKEYRDEQGNVVSDNFVTVLDVAIWSEFGTVNAPERSFVRSSFDKNRSKYNKLTENLIKKIYDGSTTVEKALDILGLTLENDIKKFIRDGDVTPESLRAAQEGGTTLWDTGQLLNSITYIKVMN